MVSVEIDMHGDGVTLSFDASSLNDEGISMVIRKTLRQINDGLLAKHESGTDMCVVDPRSISASIDPDTRDVVCTAPFLSMRIKREPGNGPPRARVVEEGRSTPPSELAQALCSAANGVPGSPRAPL